MAMVRTIQHPGVQIQETQIGGYSNPVILNNTAYIMGFTDRGPIYDYSWIMNRNDFTKIYGQPQTEAEKYLFTAVQSVLANGGTPIVARIPYDNKQCQAYKGIKFQWATKEYFKLDGNPQQDPIIPLSALTSGLVENKLFTEIFTSGNITSGGVPYGTTIDQVAQLEGLGVSALLTMLNPIYYKSITSGGISGLTSACIRDGFEKWGFEINGVAPAELNVSEGAVSGEFVKLVSGYTFNRSDYHDTNAYSYPIISGNCLTKVTIESDGFVSGTIENESLLDIHFNKLAEDSKHSFISGSTKNHSITYNFSGYITDFTSGGTGTLTGQLFDGEPKPSATVSVNNGTIIGNVANFQNLDILSQPNSQIISVRKFKLADIDFAYNNSSKINGDEVKNIIKYLKDIYNDVKFFGKTQKDVTKLQAKLLATPQMGYKNGIYLNASECQISNQQYDDLATVNQFKNANKSTSKYGSDIQDANFLIVDKQKTVATGTDGNIGYFTTVIDPFDGLKVQRLLVNPKSEVSTDYTDVKTSDYSKSLKYWAAKSYNSWNDIYDTLIDSMDTLQRVRTAEGLYIGEDVNNANVSNSWVTPLVGEYYGDSVSKTLMKKFPAIPMADINAEAIQDETYSPSIIDHQYSSHIMVAVCKTYVDQSTGKIGIDIIETFFGSLFDQVNAQTGRTLFIGDIINSNSEYIEFYKNTYISSSEGVYDPPEYHRQQISQIFLKDSAELKNAALLRGIDADDYILSGGGFNDEEYQKALASSLIFVIDKKDTCIYNIHWVAEFSSFSRKESQKIIANTTGLTSESAGTTINVAKNFLVDIDRCINFIKNRDDVPITFVCDAGLTTIAQFCDNIYWNPNKKYTYRKQDGSIGHTQAGGWVTQPFAPDDDPNSEDRYITSYADIATWRKVAEKIISICSEIRKDCFAIIDAPRQLTLDGAAPKIRRSKFDNNFDKTIGKCLRYITGFNTSYAAGYYNWLRVTDQYDGKSYWMPPTSKIIGNYCYLNIANLPWLAPAGLTYGVITGCHAISHNPDYQEEDQIYMKSWNYIKQYPAEGFVVEGQRTLLGKQSVFERINVRLLFLDLERFAYNVSRTFKYQVNNAYTREQFVATLKPKFEDYTLRGGIYEYLIKVDSQNNTPQTIDQNELRGDIFIKPARLIEFVLLNFVGTTTGTDFNELPMG